MKKKHHSGNNFTYCQDSTFMLYLYKIEIYLLKIITFRRSKGRLHRQIQVQYIYVH